MNKTNLAKACVRIVGWMVIGALAALGLDPAVVSEITNSVGINESEVVILAISTLVLNGGFYFKDKLSKGET